MVPSRQVGLKLMANRYYGSDTDNDAIKGSLYTGQLSALLVQMGTLDKRSYPEFKRTEKCL